MDQVLCSSSLMVSLDTPLCWESLLQVNKSLSFAKSSLAHFTHSLTGLPLRLTPYTIPNSTILGSLSSAILGS